MVALRRSVSASAWKNLGRWLGALVSSALAPSESRRRWDRQRGPSPPRHRPFLGLPFAPEVPCGFDTWTLAQPTSDQRRSAKLDPIRFVPFDTGGARRGRQPSQFRESGMDRLQSAAYELVADGQSQPLPATPETQHQQSRTIPTSRIDQHHLHRSPSPHGRERKQPGPILMTKRWSHEPGKRHKEPRQRSQSHRIK